MPADGAIFALTASFEMLMNIEPAGQGNRLGGVAKLMLVRSGQSDVTICQSNEAYIRSQPMSGVPGARTGSGDYLEFRTCALTLAKAGYKLQRATS